MRFEVLFVCFSCLVVALKLIFNLELICNTKLYAILLSNHMTCKIGHAGICLNGQVPREQTNYCIGTLKVSRDDVERVTLMPVRLCAPANIDLIRLVLHSPLLLLLFAGSFQAACVFVVMDLRQQHAAPTHAALDPRDPSAQGSHPRIYILMQKVRKQSVRAGVPSLLV